MLTVQQLIPILQIAIGPVVLISGVGLLILSMTNRLGRVIDRGRSLVRELPEIPERNHARVIAQLHILSRRANLLQQAIIFAVFCVLFAAVLIITLFFTAAFFIEDAWLIGGLFICALGSLILALVAFIRELNQSLMAFHLDVGDWPKPKQ
jgi:Protein of unknown function (DUF2721)